MILRKTILIISIKWFEIKKGRSVVTIMYSDQSYKKTGDYKANDIGRLLIARIIERCVLMSYPISSVVALASSGC